MRSMIPRSSSLSSTNLAFRPRLFPIRHSTNLCVSRPGGSVVACERAVVAGGQGSRSATNGACFTQFGSHGYRRKRPEGEIQVRAMADDDSADVGRPEAWDAAPAAPIILDMNSRHQLMLGALVHILEFAKCILLARILARGVAGNDSAKAQDVAPDARISPFDRGLEEILHQLNDSQDGHAYAVGKMLICIYRGLDVCQQFLLCIQVLDMNLRHQLMLGCLVHILSFAKCILLRRILARGMASDDSAKAQDAAPDARISPFGWGLEEILYQLNDSQDGHAYAGGKILICIYRGLDVCQQFLLRIQVLDMNPRHQLMLGCLVHILGFAKCILLRRILVSRL